MSAGKGDKPRPVNKTRYDSNFAAINWKSKSTRAAMNGNTAARSATDKPQPTTGSRKEPS